jgi:hypothetical protein
MIDLYAPTVNIPVRIELRLTIQENGTPLWSVDAFVSENEWVPSYVGNGSTLAEACDQVSRVVALHANPAPVADGKSAAISSR